MGLKADYMLEEKNRNIKTTIETIQNETMKEKRISQ